MSDGIYLSGAAMISRQVQQEAVADNLANVTTPGYKSTHIFAHVLENIEATAESLRAVEGAQKSWIDFSQGDLEQTERALDFALQGKGFFVVRTPEGERYTRNGSFALDPQGTLVNANGHPVMTTAGVLRFSGSQLEANEKGELFVDGKAVGQLLLKDFDEPGNLVRAGNGMFMKGNKPIGVIPAKGEVCQGCIEGSNVRTSNEMMHMMSIMKSYESAQRIAKLQSQTLGRTVNELIRG